MRCQVSFVPYMDGNKYQHMSTKPMLEQTWGTGELIDQLAVT